MLLVKDRMKRPAILELHPIIVQSHKTKYPSKGWPTVVTRWSRIEFQFASVVSWISRCPSFPRIKQASWAARHQSLRLDQWPPVENSCFFPQKICRGPWAKSVPCFIQVPKSSANPTNLLLEDSYTAIDPFCEFMHTGTQRIFWLGVDRKVGAAKKEMVVNFIYI